MLLSNVVASPSVGVDELDDKSALIVDVLLGSSVAMLELIDDVVLLEYNCEKSL